MAVSVFKTFSAGEVLTASDLNSSLTQITGNGEDLGWPATKAKDLNGNKLILDADADSSLTADTDDQLDLELQGIDAFIFNGTTASIVNGITFFATATGSNVYAIAQGTDADVGIELRSKGSGNVILADDSGNEILIAVDVASAVNEVTITNAITTVGPTIAPSGETNVDLNITAKGTGLVKIGDGTAWTKGSDIASATTLTLGTDGNYFDVTGSTTITGITVAAGTLFMLQFDGALTFTHGATLDLPGEANITTAGGDRCIGFAQAANDVQIVSYAKASGQAISASSVNILTPNNHGLSVTQNGTVLTVALKTQDAGDPAAADAVTLPFDDADGTTTYSSITSALSGTVSSGSTLGCTNDIAFRLWYVALYNSGTPIIGIVKTTVTTSGSESTMALHQGMTTLDSTAEGGAGAADSAQVVYASSTLANQAFVILGYSDWDSGLSAVGTWDANPSRTVLYGPGVPAPGEVVQKVLTIDGADSTTTTVIPLDDTVPQNTEGAEFITRAITPVNHSNLLFIEVCIMISASAGNSFAALFQDATASAIAAGAVPEVATRPGSAAFVYVMAAGTVSSTTFKVRAGPSQAGTLTYNGQGGSGLFSDAVESSTLIVTEYMG